MRAHTRLGTSLCHALAMISTEKRAWSHAFPISRILEFARYADLSGLIPLYLCSGVQCYSRPRGSFPSGLSRMLHSVLARARSSVSGNPAQPHFRDSDWPGLRFGGSGDVDLGFAAPILVSIHASFSFFILVLLSTRGYIFSFGVLGNFLNAWSVFFVF
jgi:hypothetical protein